MPDQLRHDFLSCYGMEAYETPNIDALAAEGVRYENAYSAAPVCVPARASLLTGLNAITNGVTSNRWWLRPDLEACGVKTWPQLLNEAGYRTCAVGKMHFFPWDSHWGFQERRIAEDKRWIHIKDDYQDFLREHGHAKLHAKKAPGYLEDKGVMLSHVPWELTVDHFIGEEAVRFIDGYGSEEPFAMMVGFAGPHDPYDACPEYLEGVDAAKLPPAIERVEADTPLLWQSNLNNHRGECNGVDYSDATQADARRIRHSYAGLVRQIDHEVGAIVDSLKRKGLYEDTLIIFSSDHGDLLLDHGMGSKGNFYEGSSHVPMLVKPAGGGRGAEVSEALVELMDVTATLLAAAGAGLPDYLDSRPLPCVAGPAGGRECIIGTAPLGWMVLKDGWKLSRYDTGESTLFYLPEDPREQDNLIASPGHQSRVRELDAILLPRIMDAVRRGDSDKLVDHDMGMWADGEHGERGWVRPYPFPQQDPPVRGGLAAAQTTRCFNGLPSR